MPIKSLLSVCAVYILTSGLVLAQTEPGPGPAFVNPDGTCGLLDENQDGVLVDSSLEISANSANGNVTLICSYKFNRDLDIKRTKIWDFENTGILCGTEGGATDDWHEIISPSGVAKLTCHFKG